MRYHTARPSFDLLDTYLRLGLRMRSDQLLLAPCFSEDGYNKFVFHTSNLRKTSICLSLGSQGPLYDVIV
ncbi:hypothetical protein ACLOJK_013301 [Asimina triloba]